VPKPDKAQATAKSPYQTYLDELDRMATKVEQNEYASLRLKAAQLAQKEGVKDLTKAYEAITRIQQADSFKVYKEHSDALHDEANAYAFETGLIGKNIVAQEKLVIAYQERMRVDQLVRQAQNSGRPLDQATIDDINDMARAWIKLRQEQADTRDAMSRSFSTGVTTALDNYVRSATDAAANVTNLITGSLQRTEDAFISWAKTGKLSVKDLFGFMAEEYLRQTFRMASASLMKGGMSGLGDLFEGIGMLFGGPMHSLANGIDYVPYNGFPTVLHEGEKVLTRQDAQAARAGGPGGTHFDFSGQTLVVGDGVSRGEFASAMRANNAQLMGQLQRMRAQGAIG
jgi:hypothetical protein